MRTASTFYLWASCSVIATCLSTCASAQSPTGPPLPSASNVTTPADPGQLILSLRHSIDTGHAAEALQRIAAYRAKEGNAPGLSRVQGLAFYAEGSLKSADDAFAAALKEDPNDIESEQMRGLTLVRLGRPADAIPLLEASSARGALGKADPNYILALCYMDTRRYDDARHSFAAQFEFGPDSAEAYLVTARMLLRREFLPVAQTFAQKAIDLEPLLPLAHELLGEVALAGNHLEDAIAEFEKEKAHNPLEGSVYDRLGDAYSRAAKYDDAQRSLQEALLLEPNSTGPYILLGKVFLKKHDPVSAATYLEHANQMDPANFMTHSLLGQAYRELGRSEEATRETATAEKIQAASEPKIENVH